MIKKQNRFSEEQKNYISENFPKFKTIQDFSEEYARHWDMKHKDSLRRAISNYLKKNVLTKNSKAQVLENTDEFKAAQNRKLKKSKYYIITSEQNATPLNEPFWNNILTYKRFLNAELSVIPLRYANPNSVFKDKIHDHWSPQTKEFLDAKRHDVHKYLTILADIKTQPTAAQPLSGMDDVSGSKCCIIGHTKLHLQSLPVLEQHPKKIILTTGSVSVPNYTDSKAGKKGENHHKNGFVIVEIKDEEVFYIRQVEAAPDGSFIDLIYEVSNGYIDRIHGCEAIVLGDTHVRKLDPEIDKVTDKLLETISPKHIIVHDILDGDSVNHHILKNPIEMYRRQIENRHLVSIELEEMLSWVRGKLKYHPVIVSSNHNYWLDQYISQDWRKDIPNATEYMKYAEILLNDKAPKGLIAYILEKEFGDEIITLGDNDSFILAGHELAVHGHLGTNGSRGSFEQYRKLNYPVITGHSHTPMRRDNAMSVGTSTFLRAPYNKGASSWLNSHVILHNNGTAQHIIFIEKNFTTFKI